MRNQVPPLRSEIESLEQRLLPAGATLLKDLNLALASSEGQYIVTLPSGKALIRAIDADRRASLWATDGSMEGTLKLADVDPATSDWYHAFLGNTLFFAASDELHGLELWKTDGTPRGTTLVADIDPEVGHSPRDGRPRNFTAAGDRMYFAADVQDISNGPQLWVTDGTQAGTMSLGRDIDDQRAMAALNSHIYFAPNVGQGQSDGQLWVSDGTVTGTQMVVDLGQREIIGLTGGLGERLVFLTTRDGLRLYESTGTAEGTRVVKELYTSSDGYAYNFVRNGDLLYFQAYGSFGESSFWRSDGSADGTFIFGSRLGQFAGSAGEYAYYRDFSENKDRLYRTDGSVAGTTLVTTLTHPPTGETFREGQQGSDGLFYFRAFDPENGSELWKTDGTSQGTGLARDVEPGTAGSKPRDFGQVAGKLLFAAETAESVIELLALDLHSNILTTPLQVNGSNGSSPAFFTEFNGRNLITTTNPVTNKKQLWTTDGTAAGTNFVGDVSSPSQPTIHQGKLYFIDAKCVWRTDGQILSRITAPFQQSDYGVYSLLSTGSKLYWTTKESAVGASGTNAFLNNLAGLHARYNIPGYEANTVYESAPYLREGVWARFYDYSVRRYGWFKEANFMFYDWPGPGPEPSFPPQPPASSGSIVVNDVRYYAFDDGVHGNELWVEDSQGPRLFQDINPGPESSSPFVFRLLNEKVIFAATAPGYGREPWVLNVASAPPPPPPPPSIDRVRVAGGVLRVEGTPEADNILLTLIPNDASTIDVLLNGASERFSLADVESILIKGDSGNDSIVLDSSGGAIRVLTKIYGGAGNDTIRGGGTRDRIWGDVGADELWGSGGHDIIYGNAGRDVIWGELGQDYLDGGEGNDLIHGNDGHDRIFGRAGQDSLFGDGGRNIFASDDDEAEILG